MSYRRYYWKKFLEQLEIAVIILWKGVIRNQGHHSEWDKTWFFGNKK